MDCDQDKCLSSCICYCGGTKEVHEINTLQFEPEKHDEKCPNITESPPPFSALLGLPQAS